MTNNEVKALNEFLSLPEHVRWIILGNAAAYMAGETKGKNAAKVSA